MTAIRVAYFDGRSARRQAATLELVDGHWLVAGEFGRRTALPAEVEISEPMGAAPRQLRWPDGAFCEIADTAGFAGLLDAAGHRESAVQRMQRRWTWAAGALAGIVGSLLLVYFTLLPWLAARIAPAIPERVNAAISRQVLETIDAHVLGPSTLPAARRQAIERRFAEVAGRTPGLPPWRLHFRGGGRIGANAFALPGGDLVLLDPLVALAAGDDQVVAVLAHELGHVVHHHGMRQMIQSTVVSFVVGLWFGDVSSVAASLGALVLESRYSRDFEFEADRFGGGVVKAAGLSPLLLAEMLAKLERAHAGGAGRPPADDDAGKSGGGLLGSHPETAERIAALRALAGR